MLIVIDYNVGNVRSVCNAFRHLGCDVELSCDRRKIEGAAALVLPGVAAFGFAVNALGPLGAVAGQAWRGNFFKCAEDNSHPHWAAWAPVNEFNFHQPACFGTIRFD